MDEELVVLAQQGDRQAFESLTLAHYTRLYRVAKSILRDRPTAEDATQQAFLDIWRYIRRLRDPSRFNGWSYRLLVHACYAEAKRTAPKVGEVEPLSEDIVSTADDIRNVADRDQLERAFERMSLDHRTVIVLRHLIGMTPEEVAEAPAKPLLHSRHGASHGCSWTSATHPSDHSASSLLCSMARTATRA